MRHYLPNEVEVIGGTSEVLPTHSNSMVEPFQGFVINMNVVTRAHRDAKDKGYCLVLPIGSFEKGDLCLYELGLVVPLITGDCCAFDSKGITHYNLHYKGKRASLVFHTDIELEKYAENANHWGNNVYYN